MSFNPWHDAPIGNQAPQVVEAIIEIPGGSKAKYELDKDTGMLRLDRVLYSSMIYPHNYGFIPQTLGEDHDPLDILVLSQINVQPMCLMEAKVIGIMHMVDGGEDDDKIIAVANDDMSVNHINSISDLSEHFEDELLNFFELYKSLEHKKVEVEKLQGRDQAIKIIEEAIDRYNKKFK